MDTDENSSNLNCILNKTDCTHHIYLLLKKIKSWFIILFINNSTINFNLYLRR